MMNMVPSQDFPAPAQPQDLFFLGESSLRDGEEATSDGFGEFKSSDLKATSLVLICLLGVLPALVAFLVVMAFLVSMAQTSAPSLTTKSSVVTVPPIAAHPAWNALMTVGRKPTTRKMSGNLSHLCMTRDCHLQSQWLMQNMNLSADPCNDLYEFVCGNYQGHPEGPLTEAATIIRSAIISSINATAVPPTGQSAWQKAAGLYKACMNLASSNRDEVGALKAWLISLHLDLANLSVTRAVDPVDMAVRCSLDFGVPAVIAVNLFERKFIDRKRAMELRFSYTEEVWHRHRHQLLTKSFGEAVAFYTALLTMYGVQEKNVTRLVDKIMNYENELINSLNRHMKTSRFLIGRIEDMGLKILPHSTSDQWTNALAKYTNGTYTGGDKITYQEELLAAITELLASPSGGPDGLRCLIAWSLFRQLLAYAQPKPLVADKVPQVACYNHVRGVMELALTSRYLKSRLSQRAVPQAAAMFETIRDAFEAELQASSWLRGSVRDMALRKMSRMKAHIGSPARRLDQEYVDQYYAALPDSPTDGFFDTWRKARSALARQRWADQTHILFDISKVNAFYVHEDNAIIVSAAMLQPMFFFSDGNAAFNYGGLGDVMGHEMMHGYDVLGAQFDDSGQFNPWNTPESHVYYVNKTLCLREFHNRVRRSKRQVALNDSLDSENMADLVGAVTSYAAFRALTDAQRHSTLPWLDLTSEQLYFVGRCAKKCKRDGFAATARYASNSARCNVPVMNMAAFSEAFGCSREAPMNPVPKCSFWN